MLISSDRHTQPDLESWARWERYDHALARSLPPKEQHALKVITDFGADCYASTSWGKDSTVLVDLIGRSGLDIPIVSLVIDGYELPGTSEVRDIMLARHPHLVYDELTLPTQPNRWWSDTTTAQSKYAADIGWRMIADRYGPRRHTGIRAEESRLRTMVQDRWGDASTNAARPIGRWSATDIYSYLAHHKLPVHPAYAMSHGGRLDRRWLRVHALGGVTGSDRGRSDWETAYFGDVIDDVRTRDTIMGILPNTRADGLTPASIAAQTGHAIRDVSRSLHRLESAGRVRQHQNRNRQSTRWWRTIEWPPAPRWMRDMPQSNEPLTLDIPTA